MNSNSTAPQPPLLKFLEEHGVTLNDLIDATLEFYVPHPGVETKEKAIQILTEEFLDVLWDVNISTLVAGAFLMQKEAEAERIPGLSKKRFEGRPGLVADELIGMAIASYIAGSRGVFEFTRFDQAKPGILKRLGAITNDAIGGLVAGVSSNMYTKATKKAGSQALF
ncbi:MAG: alpha-ribazole phosphatase CobZ [Candidatus Bathyarchaeota archaeon]|nr:alpha-ribazole phosphatase CobZ [Candidatus Bathyarchaeota archaeon]